MQSLLPAQVRQPGRRGQVQSSALCALLPALSTAKLHKHWQQPATSELSGEASRWLTVLAFMLGAAAWQTNGAP